MTSEPYYDIHNKAGDRRQEEPYELINQNFFKAVNYNHPSNANRRKRFLFKLYEFKVK